MSNRVMFATQSYSTPTGCDTVTNTFTQHATTNITVSTSNLYTVAFTAPNIGESITGIAVYVIAKGTGGTITFQLQGNSAGYVDIAGASQTIATNTLTTLSLLYVRIVTPHAVISGAANYYRWRIVNTGAAGTTTFAADSAGTAIAYLSTDNRNTTTKPANTDNVLVAGPSYAAITLTLDGTQIVGAGRASTATSTELASIRQTGGLKAFMVGAGATVKDDTTANVDFTFAGDLITYNGSAWYRGTTGSPYPTALTSIYRLNQGGTGGNTNIIKANGSIRNWVGDPKISNAVNYATYVSGDGTAANPLITSADLGVVGDEIIIEATSDNATNYNECEHRYIKTRNSATSFVLSSTLGGAEAALTYTHTNARIYNIDANVKVTSTTTSHGWCYQNWETTTQTNDISKDCQFEYVGTTVAYRQAYFVTNTASGLGTCDYCKFIRRISVGLSFRSGSANGFTSTGNIVSGGVSTNTVAGVNLDTTANIVCNDFVIADEKRIATSSNGAANITFNRLEMNACGKDGGVTGTAYLTGGIYGWTFNNCNFNACRGQAIQASNAVAKFITCNFGTSGKNQTYTVGVSGLNDLLFYNCNSNDDTLISGYLTQYIGSVARFHNLNNDATKMNHIWYTPYGSARCCMTGLADTTETTAGHPTVGIYAEDATNGFTWEFQSPVFETYASNILAYLKRNATFDAAAGSVTVEIWLPGSTVADATYTMSTTTGVWEVATAAKAYTGTIDAMATIKIIVKTATAGAYLYVGDLYGGTNTVTNLNVWYNGQPSPVMFDQIGNPASIWSVLTSTLTTSGTAGKMLVDIKGTVDDNQSLIIIK